MSDSWQGEWNPQHPLPEAFLSLPKQVYADDEVWLGEDRVSIEHAFSQNNSWFSQGKAWVGVQANQARLAGFYTGQVIDGKKSAFFGYWEGMNNLQAHQTLFEELLEWAKEQGAEQIYGPINFTTFGANRLRLDSFDQTAYMGEPWNPSYYIELMEQLGFSLRYRYLSTFSPTDDILNTIKEDYLRTRPKLEKVIDFQPMTAEFWLSHLDELYPFVDQVFGNNFAYTSISKEAFVAHCGAPFASRFCPDTSVLALGKDGSIAGFFLVYPDYSPLLTSDKATGREAVVTSSAINFQEHYPMLSAPRVGLAKTAGVHPDYRSLGLFTAMGCELSLRAEGKYETLAAAMVREDNPSRFFAQRHGLMVQRQYGLFTRAL